MAMGAVFIIDLTHARPVDRTNLSVLARAAGIRTLTDTRNGTLWVVYREGITHSTSMSATIERHPGVPILYVHEAMEALA